MRLQTKNRYKGNSFSHLPEKIVADSQYDKKWRKLFPYLPEYGDSDEQLPGDTPKKTKYEQK